jgi:glycine oxidase
VDTIRGSDVVVVGGGVIGCTVALELALAGLSVTLLEARRIGGGASRAAAGMLSPVGESPEPGPFLELGLTSLGLYPDFVGRVQEAGGIDPALLSSGGLEIATTPEAVAGMRTRLAWVTRYDPAACFLEADEVRSRVPHLGLQVLGALHLPGDHQVDNRLLTPAVAAAARASGVRIVEGAPVQGLLREGGRCTGVRLRTGEAVPSGLVVLAAGWEGGDMDGVPFLPLEPVRGQMAALGPLPGAPRPILHAPGVYVVTRRSGRILVGATVERVGRRPWVTPEGIQGLLSRARALLPGLGPLVPDEVWAGLRPGTPDGLPVLGPDPEVEGLLHAGGHFRNGILLAPLTGKVVADLVLARPPRVDLSPLSPGRFTHPSAPGSSPG